MKRPTIGGSKHYSTRIPHNFRGAQGKRRVETYPIIIALLPPMHVDIPPIVVRTDCDPSGNGPFPKIREFSVSRLPCGIRVRDADRKRRGRCGTGRK